MFGSQLVFSLLVAMRDETVEEAAGSALRVVAFLGLFDLPIDVLVRVLWQYNSQILLVKVTGGLLVNVLVLVDVCCGLVSISLIHLCSFHGQSYLARHAC